MMRDSHSFLSQTPMEVASKSDEIGEDEKVELVKMLKKKGGEGKVRSKKRKKRILLTEKGWQVPVEIMEQVETLIRQENQQMMKRVTK
jgi:hypothetical protein